MAELFETYPTMIKMASDPAQGPRKNIKHITDRFRRNAQRLRKGGPSKCFLLSKYLFTDELFPVVPFESCLDLFFATLQRHPVNNPRRVKIVQGVQSQPMGKDGEISNLDAVRERIEGMTLSSSKQHVYPVSLTVRYRCLLADKV